MNKEKLMGLRSSLRGEAKALTERDGEFDQDKFDELMAKIAEIDAKLAALAKIEEMEDEEVASADDTEDESDEERARVSHPAIIRSRGRRTANTVAEHAAREGFSVARAAMAVAGNRSLTGVEREVDDELRRSNPDHKGNFMVPLGDMNKLNLRSFNTTTGAGGVPVWTDASNFVDYLYPKMVGPELGFTYFNNLPPGTHKFPRQNAVPTGSAVAEEGAGTDSAPGLDAVQFSQHTIVGTVPISRELAMQSVIAADQLVMNSLSTQIGTILDKWAIVGGASNEPVGILNNSSVTNVVVATSNAVALADTFALERKVAEANAERGNLRYLSSPGGKAKLRFTLKVVGSTFADYIVDDQGNINGKKLVDSSQIPSNRTYSATGNMTVLIYGAWQDCVVATFGTGLSVIVDPYSLAKSGGLQITALLDADTNVLHGGSFAYIPNVLTS